MFDADHVVDNDNGNRFNRPVAAAFIVVGAHPPDIQAGSGCRENAKPYKFSTGMSTEPGTSGRFIDLTPNPVIIRFFPETAQFLKISVTIAV